MAQVQAFLKLVTPFSDALAMVFGTLLFLIEKPVFSADVCQRVLYIILVLFSIQVFTFFDGEIVLNKVLS